MIDRTLPDVTQIELIEAQWAKALAEAEQVERCIDIAAKLLDDYYTSPERAWIEAWLADEIDNREQVKRQIAELEDWLIDHNAPGWVAT